jgi:hypothetical protein
MDTSTNSTPSASAIFWAIALGLSPLLPVLSLASSVQTGVLLRNVAHIAITDRHEHERGCRNDTVNFFHLNVLFGQGLPLLGSNPDRVNGFQC